MKINRREFNAGIAAMAMPAMPSLETQFHQGVADGIAPVDIKDREPLHEFVKRAWKIIEPEPFIDAFYVKAICKHLTAVTDGKIKKLLINIGPRHTKSTIVSVIWPAWEWGPAGLYRLRYLFASHADSIAVRDSMRCRQLIESDWYLNQWGHRFRLAGDQNQKSWFANTRGGVRFAVSLGSKMTGHGGDRTVMDDPHDVKERRSKVKIEAACDGYLSDLSKRVNDPVRSARIVIAQRVAENDLSSKLIKMGYTHLSLPTEFEPEFKCKVFVRKKLFWEDPRTEPGELLNPERFTPEVVAEEKKDEALFSALHQQRPTPIEGGEVKKVWFRYWMPKGANLPPVEVWTKDGIVSVPAVEIDITVLTQVQSWDFAFKKFDDSSYVVGQVWGVKRKTKERPVVNVYLLHQVRKRMSFVESRKEMIALSRNWPQTKLKLVEDKANGTAIISSLRSKIPGILEVNPGRDSKLSRAEVSATWIETGNVYLPHPQLEPETTQAFINEWAGIPSPANWDQIDASSQFLARVYNPRRSSYTWGGRKVV